MAVNRAPLSAATIVIDALEKLEFCPATLNLSAKSAEARLTTIRLVLDTRARDAETITGLCRQTALARNPRLARELASTELLPQPAPSSETQAAARSLSPSAILRAAASNPLQFGMTSSEIADKLLLMSFVLSLDGKRADALNEVLLLANRQKRSPLRAVLTTLE